MIIDDYLCDVDNCGSLRFFEKKQKRFTKEEIQKKIISELPFFNYVAENFMNLIIANNLTTGNEQQDELLKVFLYENNDGIVNNYFAIRQMIKTAHIFGCSYAYIDVNEEEKVIIRYLENNKVQIVNYLEDLSNPFSKKYFFVVSDDSNQDVQAYAKNNRLIKKLEKDKMIYNRYNKVMFISADRMLMIRNDIEKEKGISIFDKDKLKTRSIIKLLEKTIESIEYDGLGGIVLMPRVAEIDSMDYESMLKGTKSAEEVKQKIEDDNKRRKKFADDLEKADEKKVTILDSDFEDFKQIDPKFRLTELKQVIGDETLFISTLFGIPPQLLELGESARNLSRESSIKNAMLNIIIPLREFYLTQISYKIAPLIGVDKIYIDSEELKEEMEN